MRLWGLMSATTWRTHAAPSGAAWNVGGDIPAPDAPRWAASEKAEKRDAFKTCAALQKALRSRA